MKSPNRLSFGRTQIHRSDMFWLQSAHGTRPREQAGTTMCVVTRRAPPPSRSRLCLLRFLMFKSAAPNYPKSTFTTFHVAANEISDRSKTENQAVLSLCKVKTFRVVRVPF